MRNAESRGAVPTSPRGPPRTIPHSAFTIPHLSHAPHDLHRRPPPLPSPRNRLPAPRRRRHVRGRPEAAVGAAHRPGRSQPDSARPALPPGGARRGPGPGGHRDRGQGRREVPRYLRRGQPGPGRAHPARDDARGAGAHAGRRPLGGEHASALRPRGRRHASRSGWIAGRDVLAGARPRHLRPGPSGRGPPLRRRQRRLAHAVRARYRRGPHRRLRAARRVLAGAEDRR